MTTVFVHTAFLAVLATASIPLVRVCMADLAFSRATIESIERARELAPGNAGYHRWLGISLLARHPERSEAEFREAVRLNHWDADSRMRLAMMAEARGDSGQAGRELAGAARVDATFLPRWALANFEFRRGNLDDFWHWARQALAMSYADRSQIFDLAAATGETALSERLALPNDEVWINYLAWATEKAPVDELRHAALHVAGLGRRPKTADRLGAASSRLLDLGAVDDAVEVWNAASKTGAVTGGPAARGRITNPSFADAPSGRGFDWTISKPAGVVILRETAQGGLRIRLGGDQEERCDLLWQRVAIEPRTSCRVRVRYHSDGLKTASGLQWVAESKSKVIAVAQGYLHDNGEPAELTLAAPDGWVTLLLRYQRPQGEVRASGDLTIESVEILSE